MNNWILNQSKIHQYKGTALRCSISQIQIKTLCSHRAQIRASHSLRTSNHECTVEKSHPYGLEKAKTLMTATLGPPVRRDTGTIAHA